jgi:hypothetical protein
MEADMLIVRKIVAAIMLFVFLLLTACVAHQREGAATGAAAGSIAGAMLDHRNPWRGGIIGAAIGAMLGATISDISHRGSMEAVREGRPVEYRTEDGRGWYRAEPTGDYYRPDEYTRCRKIREMVWEDGRLVKDTVREVCEGHRHERRY